VIKLDKDDWYHLAAISVVSLPALLTGWALKNALNQRALETKIYDCACFVLTNVQEYGCTHPRQFSGTDVTELCKDGGVLQKMQAPTEFDVNFHGLIFTCYLFFTAIGIAIFIIRPCARYDEYLLSKKID
jgi:hypothetical protein